MLNSTTIIRYCWKFCRCVRASTMCQPCQPSGFLFGFIIPFVPDPLTRVWISEMLGRDEHPRFVKMFDIDLPASLENEEKKSLPRFRAVSRASCCTFRMLVRIQAADSKDAEMIKSYRFRSSFLYHLGRKPAKANRNISYCDQ